jgi:hypothetical protein
MPAKDMAAYMRERRARFAAHGLTRDGKPRARPMRNNETAEDYHARIGDGHFVGEQFVPAASPMLTPHDPTSDGRLSASHYAIHQPPTFRSQSPSSDGRLSTPYAVEPPRSMLAIGGKAGKGRAVAGYDPQRAPLGPQAVEITVNTVHMFGALAARSDALERRVAYLEGREAEREAAKRARAGRWIDAGLEALRLAFGPA